MTLERSRGYRNWRSGVVINTDFVFTVNPANTSTGSSTSTQFKLPLLSTGTYDFDVDWGDSTSDTITVWNAAATTHTYPDSTVRTITISRTIEGWRFANTGDRLKILDIQNWGILNTKSVAADTAGAFYGCSNLNVTATDSPIFESGAHQAFFRGCTSLVGNSSFNNWDVSNISNFSRFFDSCSSFNQNIGSWDVSNSGSFALTFNSATSFNQNIGSWDVSSGTIFSQMFRSASSFNQNIGNWDMSNATTLVGMFLGATSFNNGGSADINNWDVSNVTIFGGNNIGIFQSATAFNQPLGGWNVSKATSLVDFMRNKTAANYSAANLDAIYNGWSGLTFVNTGLSISFGTAKYTAGGSAGKAILTGSPNNWTITDGGI